MRVIRTVSALRKELIEHRSRGKAIGLVPTMGALHDGHLSLMRRARKDNDTVVVSIFVNPTQFGPREDYRKYPRNFPRDTQLCKKSGVDFIFYPSAQQMFGKDYKTYVEVQELSDYLCGASRPGHFRGVATVVAKLFNIIQPDTAYFGQKDAQQARIIKKMSLDLNFPVKIKLMPIVREEGGLAMSSRNRYLSASERKSALVLWRSLKSARRLIKCGEINSQKIVLAMRQIISKEKRARIDYISIVDPKTLRPIKNITSGFLIAIAVRIGKTRLIDNLQ